MTDPYTRLRAEIDALKHDIEEYVQISSEQAAEIVELREALALALEYWSDRQQRYKNRAPVWVQKARAALAQEQGEKHDNQD